MNVAYYVALDVQAAQFGLDETRRNKKKPKRNQKETKKKPKRNQKETGGNMKKQEETGRTRRSKKKILNFVLVQISVAFYVDLDVQATQFGLRPNERSILHCSGRPRVILVGLVQCVAPGLVSVYFKVLVLC